MKKLLLTSLALAAFWLTAFAEELEPIPIGGSHGQSAQLNVNGQHVQVSVTGNVVVEVHFVEVSSERVQGVVERISSGSTSGNVTISWTNWGQSITVHISGAEPNVFFSLEGGDGDKNTNSSTIN